MTEIIGILVTIFLPLIGLAYLQPEQFKRLMLLLNLILASGCVIFIIFSTGYDTGARDAFTLAGEGKTYVDYENLASIPAYAIVAAISLYFWIGVPLILKAVAWVKGEDEG